jgi:hypothetical protein
VHGWFVWVGLLAAGGGTPSESAAERLLRGTFRAVDGRDDARRVANAAIDEAIESMNFLARPFARKRLRKATEPCGQIRFAVEGEEVHYQCDARREVVAPADGRPVKWKNDGGDEVTLRHELDGLRFVQTFATENGERETAFVFTPAGDAVRMDVTIRSGRLPRPIKFSRWYRR